MFWKKHLVICKTWYRLHKMLYRYHRGGRPPPPSRIRTSADPCLSLYYFEISIFGDGRKTFLKAPLAPIVRGDRAPKKRDFLVNIFQNGPKTLFGLFSTILPAAPKNCPNQGFLSILGELGKSNWST